MLPAPCPAPSLLGVVYPGLVLKDPTREQLLDWRTCAGRVHQIVFDHNDRCGEMPAQRLFTRARSRGSVQRVGG